MNTLTILTQSDHIYIAQLREFEYLPKICYIIQTSQGVLHYFQYGEVHANIWGLKFYVNQYLGSVNHNMDQNSIFRVHKSEKGRIVEFGAGLQNIGLNIWGPQNVRLNIWGPARK